MWLIGTLVFKLFYYHMTSYGKGITPAFCCANFVCGEISSTFSSVILPIQIDAFIPDFCSFEIGYR